MPEASWRATVVKTWSISFLNVTLYFPYLSISFHIFPYLSIFFHLELNARLFRMGSFCRRLLFLEGFRTRPWVGNSSHPQPASTSWVSPGADLSGRTRRGLPQKRVPSSCSVLSGRFYFILVGRLFFLVQLGPMVNFSAGALPAILWSCIQRRRKAKPGMVRAWEVFDIIAHQTCTVSALACDLPLRLGLVISGQLTHQIQSEWFWPIVIRWQ